MPGKKIIYSYFAAMSIMIIMLIIFIISFTHNINHLGHSDATITNSTIIHQICNYCPPGLRPIHHQTPISLINEIAAINLGKLQTCEHYDCYHVEFDYTFTVNHKVYRDSWITNNGEYDTTQKYYKSHSIGKKIPIFYLTNNPQNHWLTFRSSCGGSVMGIVLTSLVIFFCCLPLFGEIKGNYQSYRERRKDYELLV